MTHGGVLGLLMVRDEWPLLAVCAEHVLAHVDRLVVLDHASTDGSPAGLRALQARHGGRLQVLRLEDGDFQQEAATSVLLAAAGARDHDWVYVVDADEFVLTPAGTTLRDVLAGIDPDVDAVRYELDHWVSTPEFAEDDPRAYRSLRRRAVPTADPDLPWAEAAARIEAGDLGWFDLPFPSKVIARGRVAQWLFAGSHAVRWPERVRETAAPSELLRVAHLSLLSRERLHRKAAHGAVIESMGWPAEHSWQNRLIRRLEEQGRLEEFWLRHTDGASTVPDDALAAALQPALVAAAELLAAAGRPAAFPPPDDGPRAPGTVAMEVAIAAVADLQGIATDLQAERAALQAHGGALSRDLQELVAVHETTRAELRSLGEAYAGLKARYDAVLASASWRATAPLRQVSRRLRRTGSP